MDGMYRNLYIRNNPNNIVRNERKRERKEEQIENGETVVSVEFGFSFTCNNVRCSLSIARTDNTEFLSIYAERLVRKQKHTIR